MKKESEMEKTIFESSEIFEEIPGDPENILFKIPPEIIEKTGWKEGDVLNIKVEDGKIVINKKE